MTVPSNPIRGRYPIPAPDGYCPAELDSPNTFTANNTFSQNVTVTGDLTVVGDITGSLTIASGVEFEGGFTCDTDRFVVADVTGAMTSASTITSGTTGSNGGLTIKETTAGASVIVAGSNGELTLGDGAVVDGTLILNDYSNKEAFKVSGGNASLELGASGADSHGNLNVYEKVAGISCLKFDAADQILHVGGAVNNISGNLGGVISLTNDVNPAAETININGPTGAITATTVTTTGAVTVGDAATNTGVLTANGGVLHPTIDTAAGADPLAWAGWVALNGTTEVHINARRLYTITNPVVMISRRTMPIDVNAGHISVGTPVILGGDPITNITTAADPVLTFTTPDETVLLDNDWVLIRNLVSDNPADNAIVAALNGYHQVLHDGAPGAKTFKLTPAVSTAALAGVLSSGVIDYSYIPLVSTDAGDVGDNVNWFIVG